MLEDTRTGDPPVASWPNLRCELERLQVGTFEGPGGTFRRRTETTQMHAVLAWNHYFVVGVSTAPVPLPFYEEPLPACDR